MYHSHTLSMVTLALTLENEFQTHVKASMLRLSLKMRHIELSTHNVKNIKGVAHRNGDIDSTCKWPLKVGNTDIGVGLCTYTVTILYCTFLCSLPCLVECWFKRLDKEHLTLIKQWLVYITVNVILIRRPILPLAQCLLESPPPLFCFPESEIHS